MKLAIKGRKRCYKSIDVWGLGGFIHQSSIQGSKKGVVDSDSDLRGKIDEKALQHHPSLRRRALTICSPYLDLPALLCNMSAELHLKSQTFCMAGRHVASLEDPGYHSSPGSAPHKFSHYRPACRGCCALASRPSDVRPGTVRMRNTGHLDVEHANVYGLWWW